MRNAEAEGEVAVIAFIERFDQVVAVAPKIFGNLGVIDMRGSGDVDCATTQVIAVCYTADAPVALRRTPRTCHAPPPARQRACRLEVDRFAMLESRTLPQRPVHGALDGIGLDRRESDNSNFADSEVGRCTFGRAPVRRGNSERNDNCGKTPHAPFLHIPLTPQSFIRF